MSAAQRVQSGANPELLLQTGVRLLGIAVRSLSYREVTEDTVSGPRESPQTMNVSWEFESGLAVVNRHTASIRMKFTFKPDEAVRPIEVVGDIQALFSRDEAVSPASFINYLNTRGGTMLIPYIREAISSITSRGVYGPIFVDPMAFAAIAPHDVIAGILTQYENAIQEEDDAAKA